MTKIRALSFMRRTAAVVLALSAFVPAARAAEYFFGSADTDVVRVDFPAADLAVMDAGTMTVVSASVAGTFVLSELEQQCSCPAERVFCHPQGIYRGRAAAPQSLFAFPGKHEVSEYRLVAMKESAATPESAVKAWGGADYQNGISLSQGSSAGGSLGLWGPWDFDGKTGEAVFESASGEDSVTVSSDDLKGCRVSEGGDFRALDCAGTQNGRAGMYGWLYYKDDFVAQYTCDDCALPDLRVSGAFEYDGQKRYVVESGKASWLIEDSGTGFLPLKAPGRVVPACKP